MSSTKSSSSSPARFGALTWPSLILAGVLAACALVLFCYEPTQYTFYPTCLFHRATGLLCPGCGSLRALHQLLHGHLATAFRCNALLLIALPFVGWFAVREFWRTVQGLPLSAGVRLGWMWAGVVVLVVFGVVRNLPFESLAWLRP